MSVNLCMRVHVCALACVCTLVRLMQVCLACVGKHRHTSKLVHMCECVCMSVNLCVRVHVCTHMGAFACMCILVRLT